MVALAFEIEHGVDDVFQHLGAGEAAVLGDVADEKGRQVVALGGEQELRRGFAHLADAARRRLELEREHRLDRVDDEEPGPHPPDFLENPLDAGFGEQEQRRVADAEALPAGLHLMLRFLTRRVQHRPVRPGEIGRHLQ